MNLKNEFERLRTFPIEWQGHFRKGDLARDGFYYLDRGLCCKCVFCNVEIEAVNTGGTLDEHHRMVSPDCDLAHGRDTDNLPLGEANNYKLEKHRLVSFLRTSWWAPVDPYDLAKWGFYWTGTADVGRCTFCRLEVRGWEQGDRGQSEHMRWNPQCVFMQGRAVGNVPLGEEIPEQQGALDIIGVQHIGARNMTMNQLGVTLITPPKRPEFSTVTSRLSSFAMWPISVKQRPSELSEAGFFYTGTGDRVVCYQCGGGLKDWGESDLPWVEHAVWFPQCSYLKLKKSPEFIASVQQARESSHQDVMTRSSTVVHQFDDTVPRHVEAPETGNEASNAAESSGTVPEPPDLGELPQVNRDSRVCSICLDKEIGIVFLPCGHMATCPDCASQLSNCPICRTKTNAYVRAFLP